LPADHAFKCRDLRLVLLKKIRRSGIFIKCPGLKLVNPDPDQVARDVVTFGETVECLASEEFLGNLPLEVDAVGTVPGHGFHPLKARLSWSIPNPQDVHRQGRTPIRGQIWEPIDSVIGMAKLMYVVWGDTVNTASRMETFGAADRIHVSAEMRDILGGTYLFESRGKLDIKGKGMMETYFLIGRRSDE